MKGKGKEFVWGDEHKRSYVSLQEYLLKDGPILAIPNPRAKYRVEVDSSDIACGGALFQWNGDDWELVELGSKKFSDTQKKYGASERECLGLIWGVTKWRYYLYGKEFDLITDHKPLVWLDANKNTRAKLWRWSVMLDEYDYKIMYKAGKENIVPDSMSRYKPWILEGVSLVSYHMMRQYKENGTFPIWSNSRVKEAEVKRLAPRYELEDGVL